MAPQRPLDSPQNIVANEANIRNVDGNYYDNSQKIVVQAHSERHGVIDRLLKHVATGALHDSAERGPDAPKCHPETRVAVQKDIMSWIRHGEQDDAPKRILWLSGPAGSGKTAIVGTIADECYKEGLLAASFFFSAFAGSANRHLKGPVIPTLVYRLIQHKSIVGLREEVLAVIDDDPGVFERHLDQQLEELILKPLRNVSGRSNCGEWPAVIIVDGVDECQGESGSDGDNQASRANAHKEVLSVLSRACTDPAFPFRIIIASRPEPVIRHFFSASPDLVLSIFLDDKYEPDADIRLFLEAMLGDLRRRRNLPSTWADRRVIDLLVKEASGQFIYAATVVRFLSDHRHPPQKQLERVLEWRRLDDSQPFAPLDALYSRILHTSPEPLLAVTWLLVIHTHTTTSHRISYVKELLESYPGETEYVLGDLTSLVRLANEQGNPDFHFYHKSFLDFLRDKSRSSELYVTTEYAARFTRDRYYEVLRGKGPQLQPGYTPSAEFLRVFCMRLDRKLDLHKEYSSSDVEWWLANIPRSGYRDIPEMFASAHKECNWRRCLPACRVWREGILQYCKKQGWRLPTKAELLRDRTKKFMYYYGRDNPDFPLQPPPGMHSEEELSEASSI